MHIFNAAQPGVGRVQVLVSKKFGDEHYVSLYTQGLRIVKERSQVRGQRGGPQVGGGGLPSWDLGGSQPRGFKPGTVLNFPHECDS